MEAFDVRLVVPVITLVAYALLVLLSAPFFRRGMNALLGWIAFGGAALAAILNGMLWRDIPAGMVAETANGLVRIDRFGMFFTFVILAVTALSILVSIRFLEREEASHGEFYALMLLAAAGMVVMVSTTHLMMVLIGLEVFSLSLYVLTGLTRGRARSIEAALKYFLLGAFSSGFLVYGMALLYGTSGSLNLLDIGRVSNGDPGKLFWIGLGMLLIGFFFKIAAVPFHHWVPDVYQGAPTNVTGFMAAATKTVAFAVLVRILIGAFGDHPEIWTPIVKWLAILTMTVANLVALAQTDIKRLLAFSSIAHAGYLLIAMVCLPEAGVSAIVFYLTAYAFMTVGAFTVVAAVGKGDAYAEHGYDLSYWHGLGWSRPVLGLAMSVFLFSLAGIPPTGGFFGKYAVFQAAIVSKQYLLATVGVLNAVVAAYYYLRVIVAMYMSTPESDEQPLPVTPTMAVVVIVSVVAVLYLGLAPSGLLSTARELLASVI